jgi:hypothetical protein
MLARRSVSTLILFAPTTFYFPITGDECSTAGAYYGFVVVQRFRIAEIEASASGATELGIRVSVAVESHDVVGRHGLLVSVGHHQSLRSMHGSSIDLDSLLS